MGATPQESEPQRSDYVPDWAKAERVSFAADARLVVAYACPVCGAGVFDLELHRQWHSTLRTRGA